MLTTLPPKIIVNLELFGGVDFRRWLIAPQSHGDLLRIRPTIMEAENETVRASEGVRLPSYAGPLVPLFQGGNVQLIQGVGFPGQRSIRSHFRSSDIMASGVWDKIETTGWLGRYLADCNPGWQDKFGQGKTGSGADGVGGLLPPLSVTLGPRPHKTCESRMGNLSYPTTDPGYSAANILGGADPVAATPAGQTDLFIRRSYLALDTHASSISEAFRRGRNRVEKYGGGQAGEKLRYAARLIDGGLGTVVYNLQVGGWDHHANQNRTFPKMVADVSQALAAFWYDLEAAGKAERVLITVGSEFQRKDRQNGNGGCDHGDAFPLMLIGAGVGAQLPSIGEVPKVWRGEGDRDSPAAQFPIDEVQSSIVRNWLEDGGDIDRIGSELLQFQIK